MMKFRFSPSRLALGYIALSVFVLALFAIPLWYAWRANLSTFREYVQGEAMQRWVELFNRKGAKGVVAAMKLQVRSLPGDKIMIFADTSKLRLAGNLPEWPLEVPDTPGTYGLVIGLGGGSTMRVVASHVRLPGGYHLLMGRESVRFESIVERFWYGIAGAMGTVLILGASLGWLIRRALLSDVHEMSRTASAIVEGDLSRRIPKRGGSAELETLAQTVNGMLEQLARKNVQLEGEVAVRRQAEQALHRAHDDLEGLVAERTAELARVNESLRRSQASLLDAQQLSRTGSWTHDFSSGRVTTSPEALRMWGIQPEDDASVADFFFRKMHPEDRLMVEQAYGAAQFKKTDFESDFRIILPDGTIKNIHTTGHPILNGSGDIVGFVGASIDLTERKQAEALLAGEKRLLEMIAQGNALSMILDTLCRLVEELSKGSLSSILLLDPDGSRLWHGAAPSLPKSYTDAIDGAFIGPAVGSCGTAAYRKEPVIVSDIAQDPLWADYRDLALSHGLRACWSTPVLASDSRVLGTFAIYSREPRSPTPQQQNIIEQITDLASIAIERKRREEERQAHLWFLERTDQVNRAIQGTNDLEQMMSDVLDAVLSIFHCDRAWLVYPCDPEAPSWKVPMEHARPEFPGAFALGLDLPVDLDIAKVFQSVRASTVPVTFSPGSEHPLPAETAKRFGIQSMIAMSIYPKGDKPYMLGLHQCSYPRVWTPQEERLFQEIGRRLEDELTSLLMFRNLGESERKLEEAQRLTHVGYWERDPDTDLITWSDETYRIFGLQPQARILNVAQLPELIHPEDKQIMVQAAAEALRGGPRYDVEYRVVRPNGEVRLVHSRGDVIRDESGRPRRMFGTVQDITERKQAEQRLMAQHTVTQILAQAATLQEATARILQAVCECLVWDVGTLWSIDREAGLLRCVEVWHKESVEVPEFETASRESTFMPGIGLPGRVWFSREPAYIPDVVHDANFLRAPIAAREVLHAAFGFPILLGGDVLGVMEFFSHEIRQPDQELLNMMATVGSQIGQFIERKRAEDELHYAQMELAHVTRLATLGEMTASIAHEINQPLGAVVNSASACLRWLDAQKPEEARRSASRVIAEGHRASEIIGRIRALVRKAPPRIDRVDVNETIHEVIALAHSEVQRNGVALETQLSEAVPVILADQIQLQQVLLNLMMNAIEAMSGAGEGPRELLVRSGADQSQGVLVSVQDSGPGFDPKSLDHLFDAFYTTKPQGLGMGLAISRSLIEAHGGRLWATTNAPHGAVFQFTLPIGGDTVA